MRLLERYVLFELTRIFIFLLSGMTLLLVSIGVIEQSRQYGLGPWQALQIIPFVIPRLLPYTIPVALLLTTCVVYGRMSGDREIIAAKAAGIHVMNLIWPSFFLAGLLSVGSLLITDQVIPWSTLKIETYVALAMEDIFLDVLRTQNYLNEGNIRITVKDVQERTLIEPVFRYAPPNGGNAVVLKAEEALIHFDLPNREVILKMKNVWVYPHGAARIFFDYDERSFKMPERPNQYQVGNLRLKQIESEIEKTARDSQLNIEAQSLATAFHLTTGDFQSLNSHLMTHQEGMRRLHVDVTRRYRTEYHNRFAMAMSCFFFVIVGSPFSILSGKKQFLTSFLFVFAPILLIYYPVTMMTQNLSKAGSLDPSYAVWAANAILFLVGCVCLRMVSRN